MVPVVSLNLTCGPTPGVQIPPEATYRALEGLISRGRDSRTGLS